MTKYERAAREAVATRLAGCVEPCSLWSISCTANQAARDCGRRTDLYESLYEYADLLPGGWKTSWLTAHGGSGDNMLMAVPPNWVAGRDRSRSLLLGAGLLVPADVVVD